MKYRVGFRQGDSESSVREVADAREALAFVTEAAENHAAILIIETADGRRIGNDELGRLAQSE
jgi:hypothetical protein